MSSSDCGCGIPVAHLPGPAELPRACRCVHQEDGRRDAHDITRGQGHGVCGISRSDALERPLAQHHQIARRLIAAELRQVEVAFVQDRRDAVAAAC